MRVQGEQWIEPGRFVEFARKGLAGHFFPFAPHAHVVSAPSPAPAVFFIQKIIGNMLTDNAGLAFAQALDDVRTNRGIDRIVRCGMRGRIVAGFGDFGILLFRLLFRWINLALRAGRLRRIVALLTTLRGLADRTPIGAPPSDDAGGNWAPRS